MTFGKCDPTEYSEHEHAHGAALYSTVTGMQPSDPFEVVQEEARQQLLEISAQLSRWQDLKRSSTASDEAGRVKSALSRSLGELTLDLQDLQATVNIAGRDPAKYSLTQQELDRRVQFVAEMQAEAKAVQVELDGVGGARSKGERQGLLGASKASSSSSTDPDAPTGQPNEVVGARARAMRKENADMLEAQHQQQQAQVEMQDVELGGLAESVDRLGVMGRSMNDELRAQGKAFDQFTQEVRCWRA